MNTLET